MQRHGLEQGITGRNSSLTILNVSEKNIGSYSCVAINAGGMAERNASIILMKSPLFLLTTSEILMIIFITGISAVLVAGLLGYHICIYRLVD